jgi:hypothetical protein
MHLRCFYSNINKSLKSFLKSFFYIFGALVCETKISFSSQKELRTNRLETFSKVDIL